MLDVQLSPDEKRRRFRARLDSGELLRFPGAFSPLVARLIERQGFDGLYISGAALSADLGLPDIALTSLHEVADRAAAIAGASNLPTLVDADTGFGEAMNAARTVRILEERGLAGCHLEDQVSPKRCGHLDNKTLISAEAMAQKVAAAVAVRKDPNFLIMARTDALAVEGLPAALERARAYVAAGADAIFMEAVTSKELFAEVRAALDVPLLANMTEFGKSPILSREELSTLGYNIVIYPVSTLRLAMKAVEEGLAVLAADGDQRNLVSRMQTRAELYDLLGYSDYGRFDARLTDFSLAGGSGGDLSDS